MRTLTERLDPFLLCWGVSFCAVAIPHLILDWLTPAMPMGALSLAGACFAALVVGSVAALFLEDLLEPADLAGGGRVLVVLAVVSAVAALLEQATWPPRPYWDALGDALLHRLVWSPLLLAAVLPAVLFNLDLGEDEPFFDGRFRRAVGYWLAAWSPPGLAFVLLHPRGTDAIVWVVALLIPSSVLLGTLGVRLREAAFHDRLARGRLGLVSALGTAVFVALGTARELAS